MTKRDKSDEPATPRDDGAIAVISANSCWNIVNFRAGLIRALIGSGFRVVVVAPADSYSAAIAGLGATFVPLAMNSSGLRCLRMPVFSSAICGFSDR